MKIDLTEQEDYSIVVNINPVPTLRDCHQIVIETDGAFKSRREFYFTERQVKTLSAFLEVYCTDEFRLKDLFDD